MISRLITDSRRSVTAAAQGPIFGLGAWQEAEVLPPTEYSGRKTITLVRAGFEHRLETRRERQHACRCRRCLRG